MDKAIFVTMKRLHKQIRKNTWKKIEKSAKENNQAVHSKRTTIGQ